VGGAGGGGAGASATSGAGYTGSAGLGGGGGGGAGGPGVGATGGSGVVILKYPVGISGTFSGGLTTSTNTIGLFKITTVTAGTGTVTFS
jgi:hypothetical protein